LTVSSPFTPISANAEWITCEMSFMSAMCVILGAVRTAG
jgi:hypothetical protein